MTGGCGYVLVGKLVRGNAAPPWRGSREGISRGTRDSGGKMPAVQRSRMDESFDPAEAGLKSALAENIASSMTAV